MLPGTTENLKEASPAHAASKKMLRFAVSLSGRSLHGGSTGARVLERKPLLFA